MDGKVYGVDLLSKVGLEQLYLLDFTNARIGEIENQLALLQRAKNSYMASLKTEILRNKAGFTLGDD